MTYKIVAGAVVVFGLVVSVFAIVSRVLPQPAPGRTVVCGNDFFLLEKGSQPLVGTDGNVLWPSDWSTEQARQYRDKHHIPGGWRPTDRTEERKP